MKGKYELATSRFGKGLFATSRIANREHIVSLEGPRINQEQVNAMISSAPLERHADPHQIGEDLFVSVQGDGLYVNHSCDPNAGSFEDVQLIAIRDIEPGEEITFDYSTALDVEWAMRCECGVPQCRKSVGKFIELPRSIQERYLELNIVQRFIVQKYFKARG